MNLFLAISRNNNNLCYINRLIQKHLQNTLQSACTNKTFCVKRNTFSVTNFIESNSDDNEDKIKSVSMEGWVCGSMLSEFLHNIEQDLDMSNPPMFYLECFENTKEDLYSLKTNGLISKIKEIFDITIINPGLDLCMNISLKHLETAKCLIHPEDFITTNNTILNNDIKYNPFCCTDYNNYNGVVLKTRSKPDHTKPVVLMINGISKINFYTTITANIITHKIKRQTSGFLLSSRALGFKLFEHSSSIQRKEHLKINTAKSYLQIIKSNIKRKLNKNYGLRFEVSAKAHVIDEFERMIKELVFVKSILIIETVMLLDYIEKGIDYIVDLFSNQECTINQIIRNSIIETSFVKYYICGIKFKSLLPFRIENLLRRKTCDAIMPFEYLVDNIEVSL